jgi:hypothetical protein
MALLLSGEPGKETKPNQGSSLRATTRLLFVAPHVALPPALAATLRRAQRAIFYVICIHGHVVRSPVA